MPKDTIYSQARSNIEQFRFDEHVAAVFPDMLKRSVPGYALIQEMIAVLSKRYAQENSRLYDLGCSLGASCISMLTHINSENIQLIGVDNSEAMIEGAQQRLAEFTHKAPIKTPYQLVCEDIKNTSIENASIVNLNFTLQFIKPELRVDLIEKIYKGLKPGGILIVSEKVNFEEKEDKLLSELHHDFKRSQGYSELEISQKRSALEDVLIRDSEALHHERLAKAGFEQSSTWFQCFNFLSLLAIKAA